MTVGDSVLKDQPLMAWDFVVHLSRADEMLSHSVIPVHVEGNHVEDVNLRG